MLCQRPKLTPLQTRLLASLTTLALLGLLYWSLSNPHFAYAAELPVDGSGHLRAGEDHNWHRIRDDEGLEDEDELEELEVRDSNDVLLVRQTAPSQFEDNNVGTPGGIAPGNTTIWEYPNRLLVANHTDKGVGLPSELLGKRVAVPQHIELKRRDGDHDAHLETRQAGTTIYISANTCRQPIWSGNGAQDIPAPQLTLYVSNEAGNKNLGPSGRRQTEYPFDGGFVNATVPSASGTWHMAVSAPELTSNFTGSWSYSLAVSIDDYFYASNTANTSDPFLYLVDTDSNAALLVTDNLTDANSSKKLYQQWMDLRAPFTLFALNENFTGMMGLENSFCGLQNFVSNNSQILSSKDDMEGISSHVQMGMITRGLGNRPKQQFYATGLNSSSQYRAFLAMEGNSTASGNGVVRGGGKVWGAGVDFTTKSDGNCQLLFNLTYCNEVAYAVPANPSTFNFTGLQNFYEDYTQTWSGPFNYTLAQIPCNTTSDAQYSLAKNCTHCAAAYKEWLCAVSIPRCEDFSNTAPYLQVRNVGQAFYNNQSMIDSTLLSSNYVPMTDAPTIQGSNAYSQTYESSFATNRSRNAAIDETIQPGPYKEVLPCEDLCYSLMQSCPASMNFACPYPGRGLEASYGKRTPGGEVTCSYLGAVYYLNGAEATGTGIWKAVVMAIIAGLALAFV